MGEQPIAAAGADRRVGLLPALAVIAFVYACSIYANLSFAVTRSADYRFFPPFQRHVNANRNSDLAAENFNIARALVAGKGFADPFPRPTGPTAWMPPALPAVEAGLLWVCDGSREAVMAVVVFLQVNALIGTGLLILALTRQTARRVGSALAVIAFGVGLLCHFQWCFQTTQDCWLVLLAIDLLIAFACWLRPLSRWQAAAAWGLFGGVATLVNPIVGCAWGAWSLLVGIRRRAWAALGLALLVAALALTPWTVRNYLVFGRVIPVKSNLAYELYQSQCLQSDGLLQASTFGRHPYNGATQEGREYTALGEAAFLEHKGEQLRQAAWAHPQEFLRRAGHRLLGATLWCEPFDRAQEAKRPWLLWLNRLIHPLPFLASLVLAATGTWRGLCAAQWTVLGVYWLYLLPYIVVSYYERYAVPLLGVKVLLVIWSVETVIPCSHPARSGGRCGRSPRRPAPRWPGPPDRRPRSPAS